MSELPRRIISTLRRFISNRRRAKRARVHLAFTLGLADPRLNSNGSRRLKSLEGHTLDVSATGLALIVPAIRIGERYLTGEDRRLHVKLELPGGPIEMIMIPVRYESLEEDQTETGYLIGARIAEMSDTDRTHFKDYIARLHGTRPTDS